MCICINCKYVKNCSTYFLIEKQHRQENKDINYKFIPQLAIININIIFSSLEKLDWDVIECLSYVEDPGIWLQNRKI
uniref:hypothetical protein n=1 Tax=Rhodaphanes brevistipitata TaxID=446136 RepID=UPI001FCDB32E|nr:hypothetical protein MW432_pgp197 [Rhodaphanes brevistipitata]UNJ18384.1 hypothetical protein [Rhodaphanes brevistipitata]